MEIVKSSPLLRNGLGAPRTRKLSQVSLMRTMDTCDTFPKLSQMSLARATFRICKGFLPLFPVLNVSRRAQGTFATVVVFGGLRPTLQAAVSWGEAHAL